MQMLRGRDVLALTFKKVSVFGLLPPFFHGLNMYMLYLFIFIFCVSQTK